MVISVLLFIKIYSQVLRSFIIKVLVTKSKILKQDVRSTVYMPLD